MARLVAPTTAWLLAFVLPFQVLTAAYLDLRGPLHVHVDTGGHDHDHDHGHSHGGHHAERHHHPPHDPSVSVILDDRLLKSLAPGPDTPSGWSSTMFVALLAGRAPLDLLETSSGPIPPPEAAIQTRFPEPPKHPPRLFPA